MAFSTETRYTWTCDRCNAWKVTDEPMIPTDWVQVAHRAYQSHAYSDPHDLCSNCAKLYQQFVNNEVMMTAVNEERSL